MSEKYESYYENKSHTTPEFPYNTYLCSIPLDFSSVDLHWHSEAELIVIKKGRGIVEVDLKAYEVQEGNMLLVLPGQLHAIKQKEEYSMEYENILFETDFIGAGAYDKCGQLLKELFEGRTGYSTMIDQNLSYYAEAIGEINAIDILCSRKIAGYELGVKGHLLSLMYIIISNSTAFLQPSRKSTSVERVKLILSYISEHYSEKISLEDMAKLCCYSKSHFMRFFKMSMGESFTSYLCNYRLKIAAQLLVSTRDTVLEIAEKSGFDNLSFFNRQFKAKYHTTPLKYRKQGC